MTFSIGNGLYSGLSSIFSGGVGNDEDNNEQDVKTARDNLNKAGYEAGDKSSGILDRELDTATKSFQRDNGLKIDGIIRPNGETEQALNTIVKRKTGQSKEVKGKGNNFFPEMPKPLKLQSSIGDGRENKAEDIGNVENALAGLGHLKIGEFNKDKGTIRPSLVKAIKSFQKDNGLFVDGVMKPDGETQEALGKETKPYFSIMPTKEQKKQSEQSILEQVEDWLDPRGAEAREKAKEQEEKYKTPPYIPEIEEGDDLEELARQGKIFSTIPPRDREKMMKELGKIPEIDERFINKMSVKKEEEKGFLDSIGDAISGLFISEAEASELPEVDLADGLGKISDKEKGLPSDDSITSKNVKTLMGSAELDEKLIDNIMDEELHVEHLYKDSKGKITMGAGILVDSPDKMKSLPLYVLDKDGVERVATDAEKLNAYNKLEALKLDSDYKDIPASKYAPNSENGLGEVYMKLDVSRDLVTKHLHEDYISLKGELKKSGIDFDKLDDDIKMSIFDIKFNTGNFKEEAESWPTLIKAIREDDWATAIKETHRKDVGKTRNGNTLGPFFRKYFEKNSHQLPKKKPQASFLDTGELRDGT